MQKTVAKNIFISYRKQDTPGETGRLADALSQYFSEDQIFRDIERLEPGADFVEEIGKRLQSCDVMLAVIGPNWLGFREGKTPRIQDPNDWVRIELAVTLQRNIRVVPVLVNGGQLPTPEELPSELHSLLRRQTHEISEKRWKYDTELLINFLVHSVGVTPKKMQQEQVVAPTSSRRQNVPWGYISGGFVMIVVLLFILFNVSKDERKADTSNQKSLDSSTINNPVQNKDYSISQDKEYSAADYNEQILGTWTNNTDNNKLTFIFLNRGYLSGTIETSLEDLNQQTGKALRFALRVSFDGTWSIQGKKLITAYNNVDIEPLDEITFANKSQFPQIWQEIVEAFRLMEGNSVNNNIIDINKNRMSLEDRNEIVIFTKTG